MSLIRPHRRTNPSDNAVNHPKHEIHLLRSRWIWCPGQNLIEAISGPVLANSALITDKLRSPWINGRLSLPPSARPVTQPSAELRLLNSTFDQNYPGLLEQKCMIDTKLWSACKAIRASHTLPLLILLPPSTQLFLLVFLLTAIHWRGAINFYLACVALLTVYWPVQLKTPPLAYIASYYLHIFLTWPKVFLWTLPRVSVSSTSNRVDADTVKSRWVARGCLLLRCPGGSTSSAAPSVLMLDLQTVMFALCMSYKGAPVEHTWYCIGCSVGRPIVVHTMVVSSGSALRIVCQQSNLLSQIIWSFFVEGLLIH